MAKQFKFSWTCPHCNHEHSWSWPAHDEPRTHDVVNMNCEGCKASTPMEWAYGKWTKRPAGDTP